MSDCVLTAYQAHLGYLKIDYNIRDVATYRFIKKYTHKNPYGYTFSGIAPFMLAQMAMIGHGLKIDVEHALMSQRDYIIHANDHKMLVLMKMGIIAGNFGRFVTYDQYAERPAIYFDPTIHHAFFSVTRPRGVMVMSISILKPIYKGVEL